LRRNLSAAEIVDQVRAAAKVWRRSVLGPPTNVVFMGMGEPLHNYQPVVSAIRLLQEWGVSPRHVVVSTSGLVPEIDRLAFEGLPIRLAISLHAASDELRNRLVPLNRRYPLDQLRAAAQRFTDATRRRVSFEYVMIRGVNDRAEDAVALRRLAASAQAHVNLIPMNPIPDSELSAPTEPACREFAEMVGARASIRFSRGERANAACGQLRAAMAAQPRRSARSAAADLELVGGGFPLLADGN
jgi:23S rRNA (adenine2503-C2)-methyltransferase